MRSGVKAGIFILSNVLILTFLVRSVWILLCLLFLDSAQDLIPDRELQIPYVNDTRPQIIPKIIHQTYINNSIPEIWRAAQHSCLDLHPEYEYVLWTDDKAREFIATEYPSFLATYDAYPYPIQRADTLRYFVLAHYGGIYIDLDDGCERRLDPLLAYPAWLRKTVPTGISNDAMGAIPRHPFFIKVIESLQGYQRNWISPYVTVMASTGPLILSVIWCRYVQSPHTDQDRVMVLSPDSYMAQDWSFFSHNVGNSWHRSDARLLFWMGQHWGELTVIGFVVGFIVIGMLWFVYDRAFGRPRYASAVSSSRSTSPSGVFMEKPRKASSPAYSNPRWMPRWMQRRPRPYYESVNSYEA